MGELIPVVLRGDIYRLAHELDDGHIVRVGLRRIPNLIDDQLDGGIQQEDGKEVEDIRPRRDDRRTQQNEYEAEDEGDDDTDEQHLLLVLARDFKGSHDKRKYEEVIHGKRLLCDITGKELDAVLMAPYGPDNAAKN